MVYYPGQCRKSCLAHVRFPCYTFLRALALRILSQKESMKLPQLIVVCFFLLAVFSAYGDPAGGDMPGVYVAGNYSDANGDVVPCYWKDGTRHDLADKNTQGLTSAIAVSGRSAYVSGSYISAAGNMIPCYWKDGTKYDLPLPGKSPNGMTRSIVVSGGSVYVAGYYEGASGDIVPCYWKDGTRHDLSDGTEEGITSAIAVLSGTVYVTGFYTNAEDSPLLCYWKNGTRYNLSLPPNGKAISAFPLTIAVVE